MSKLKHTKGPWTVQEDWGDHYVVTEMGDYIAVASEIYPECSVSIDEDDARLIAAAPEMLDALINIVKESKECCCDEMYKLRKLSDPNCAMCNSIHSYDEIIALIEKATGLTIEEVLKDE
ncbi:MAG: hypothetical protein GY782_06495 [Gammaproteobacteria bacterium]|nr:hypothetical protein [Gammaproteobacteria bacterium]